MSTPIRRELRAARTSASERRLRLVERVLATRQALRDDARTTALRAPVSGERWLLASDRVRPR